MVTNAVDVSSFEGVDKLCDKIIQQGLILSQKEQKFSDQYGVELDDVSRAKDAYKHKNLLDWRDIQARMSRVHNGRCDSNKFLEVRAEIMALRRIMQKMHKQFMGIREPQEECTDTQVNKIFARSIYNRFCKIHTGYE